MLRKFKPADYIIIFLLAAAAVICFFVFSGKKNFSNLPVEKETPIMFDVLFRGISISAAQAPFKTDDEAFITIRNVPYKKLKINSIDGMRRLAYIPAKNKDGYAVSEDVSAPMLYDFIIRLEDTAKKTPDGYVTGGNKIKMGMPVIIEGELYRYQGTISNIIETPNQETQPE